MHFLIIRGGALEKVLLGFINQLVDFREDQDELHDMSGNTSKGGLGKGDSASHIEEFDFPSSQLSVEIV